MTLAAALETISLNSTGIAEKVSVLSRGFPLLAAEIDKLQELILNAGVSPEVQAKLDSIKSLTGATNEALAGNTTALQAAIDDAKSTTSPATPV